ncbi:hypothetical protein ACRAWD_26295 [Caulobacter segnis]
MTFAATLGQHRATTRPAYSPNGRPWSAVRRGCSLGGLWLRSGVMGRSWSM